MGRLGWSRRTHWQVSGPLCHPSFSPLTPVWVSPRKTTRISCTFPFFRICKQKPVLWSGNLFINPKRFFAECFWASVDYYFNFFPQIFSPYLGKRLRIFVCLFIRNCSVLEKTVRPCLRSLVGDSGLSLQDQLCWPLTNSGSHTHTVAGQEMSVHKNSWRKTPPLAQEFLISGHFLFPGDKDLFFHSWQVRAERPSNPHPILQRGNWGPGRRSVRLWLSIESFSPNAFTLKNVKSIGTFHKSPVNIHTYQLLTWCSIGFVSYFLPVSLLKYVCEFQISRLTPHPQ